MSKRSLYRAIWVPSGVVLIGIVVAFASLPTSIPIAADTTTFTSATPRA